MSARTATPSGGASRYGATMVETPHRYVDWLMYEAHGAGAPREGGAGYPLLRADIYDAPPDPVPSPAPGISKKPSFPNGSCAPSGSSTCRC